MQYTEEVIKHFKNPKNQGVIKNADAVGEKGNPVCGDVMKMYLKIKPAPDSAQDDTLAVIEDVKFETLGCVAAIAISSSLTEMVKGKTLKEALQIKKNDIVNALGGLPMQKIHCSMLGIDALHKAVREYLKSRN